MLTEADIKSCLKSNSDTLPKLLDDREIDLMALFSDFLKNVKLDKQGENMPVFTT